MASGQEMERVNSYNPGASPHRATSWKNFVSAYPLSKYDQPVKSVSKVWAAREIEPGAAKSPNTALVEWASNGGQIEVATTV